MLRYSCASESPGKLLKHRLLSPLHPPSFCLNRSGKGPEGCISDTGTPGLGVFEDPLKPMLVLSIQLSPRALYNLGSDVQRDELVAQASAFQEAEFSAGRGGPW